MSGGSVKLRTLVGSQATDLPVIPVVAAAVPFASFAQTGATTSKTLPDHIASKASIGHTALFDADYVVAATDVHVGLSTLTASRMITLVDVEAFPRGQDLVIGDETGACSDAIRITIQVGAGTNDSIPQTGSNTVVLQSPYASVRLRRGAANVWLIV